MTDGNYTKILVCERFDSLSDSCTVKLSITGTPTLLRQYDVISSLATLSWCCRKHLVFLRLLSFPRNAVTIFKAIEYQ